MEYYDNNQRKFKVGGPVTPIDPKVALRDFRAYHQRIVDANPVRWGMSDLKRKEVEAMISAPKSTVAAIDRGEVHYNVNTGQMVNGLSGKGFSLLPNNGNYQYSANGDNRYGRVGFMDGKKGVPALSTPAPILAGQVVASSARIGVPTTTAAVSSMFNRLAVPKPSAVAPPLPIVSPPVIGTPASLSGGVGKVGTMITSPLQPAKTELPYIAPLATKKNLVGVPNVPTLPIAAADALSKRDLITPPKPEDKPPLINNLGASLANAARLITGGILAGGSVPMPTIPERWSSYAGEVTAMKNNGLSAAQNDLATNAISNNYQQGVTALTRGAGGGSTPGVLLSGLSALGQQRNVATANLSAANVAAQQTNFGRYGAIMGQTAQMEAGIQQEGINRAAARQQIGAGLIGSTLQNMEQGRVFNQNQPLYDKYNQSQIDANNESTETQRALRLKYLK